MRPTQLELAVPSAWEPAMSEIEETIQEAVERAASSKLNSWVAILVSLVATFMALCNVKDGNVTQGMAQAQSRAVDAWTYYQAKGTKQNIADASQAQLEVQRDTTSNLTPAARAELDRRIAEYAAKSKLYESEKAKIKQDAEGFELEYDRLNLHDDQFDAADACLSLAIALLGVTALTQKRWLFFLGAGFAALGMFSGLCGFLDLAFRPEFLAKLLG
jgi:hypothetical protein